MCLTITADCGGSNGVQVKLWKRELQGFANETGLKVTVAHLPPATSSSDGEMQAINITRDEFHGEWNYTISPNQQPP